MLLQVPVGAAAEGTPLLQAEPEGSRVLLWVGEEFRPLFTLLPRLLPDPTPLGYPSLWGRLSLFLPS